ncbi:hypothetical protein P0W64_06990 [Tsukamurella sp. 8F]|uniref:hypothetical protein n=1 Tax=unclassified Tsukamurella TaxID=2633480 RepID=UPI0023B95094|nr:MULTISPECIES: hypothetical protein [unclassified Tsukamurella]MDF0530201.1 hypothetical protein [Tsukamurella sp. 8J]MDF0586518.1 hypothetical protein [Tsukamurella sp. 8F]
MRGLAVLRERIRRVAQAGRLRISEARATALVRTVGIGLTLSILETPADERDPEFAEAAWDMLAATVLTGAHEPGDDGARAAAVWLRADDQALGSLSPGEGTLMREWLDRIARR